jgi:hypothetical protein
VRGGLGKQRGSGKQKTRADEKTLHDFFLQAEPSFKGNGLDAMIVALRGMAREAELFPSCAVHTRVLNV